MRRREFLVALATATIGRRALGWQEPAAPPARTLDTPRDAVSLAMLDVAGLLEEDRLFTRYLWQPDPTKESTAAVTYGVNTAVSRSATIVRPVPVAGGRLLRFDLRELAPNAAEFIRLGLLWESLAFSDPWFHVQQAGAGRVFVPLPEFTHTDGKRYSGKRFIPVEYPIHADINNSLSLGTLTGSGCPVLRADWFLARTLTQLDGGLYYALRGLDKGVSLDEYLRRFGTTQKALDDAARTARIGIIESQVTGKTRCVVLLYGTQVRPTDGVPIIAATLDISDADVDPEFSAIQNLISFDFRAIEMLVYLPNGFIEATLWNAAGELQDSVPDNIAHDHTIPRPHTSRLQPMVSCISCHAPSDMFLPAQNDAQALLEQFAVLDDLTALNRSVPEIIEDLRGMYGGDSEDAFRLARNAHEDATFRACGTTVQIAATACRDAVHAYTYQSLDAVAVCRACGYAVEDEAALALFNQLCPPTGNPLEHSTIAQIQIGLKATRTQFDAVLPEILTRAFQTTDGDNP